MNFERKDFKNRREFMKLFSMGSLMCFGCGSLGAFPESNGPFAGKKHKFQADAKMSFAEVFMNTYRNQVALLNVLAEKMGREKFFEMLKEASSIAAARGIKKTAPKSPANSLAAFISPMKKPNRFWNHALTHETVKESPSEYASKITECIWATTFKRLKATDIGYALICHPDFAMAQAFNPKLKLSRTKTLMQGHDCCNHHWVMES